MKKTKEIKIQLPHLHYKQQEIWKEFQEDANCFYYIVAAGRRFGKTFLSLNFLMFNLISNPNTIGLYCARWYSQSKETYQEFLKIYKDCPIIERTNGTELSVLLKNGSRLSFEQVQNHDSIRGKTIHYMVLDEFALYTEESYYQSIQPTMATTRPKCLIISTPRGKGLFYQLYTKGLDINEQHYKSIQAPSNSNPLINQEFMDDVKRSVNEKIYKQEYLAEFIDDTGSVFTNIRINLNNEIVKTKYNWAGLDIGIEYDYTVLTIINEKNQVIYWDRFNKVSLREAAKRIAEACIKHNVYYLYIEDNQYQGLYDMIKEAGFKKLHGYTTTRSSKPELIENLIDHFESGNIQLPDHKYFISEFEIYEHNYNKVTRSISYSAPSGAHDDIVMSTALAFMAKKEKRIKII